MPHIRNAKIIATLGPASSTPEAIRGLFEAGADVFRLNFSHGEPREHAESTAVIRELEKNTGRPIGVLMDLQGPKLRIGAFRDGKIALAEGAPFRLDLSSEPGDATRASLPHPELFSALGANMDLLLDDGRIRLTIRERGEDFAETVVVTGGELSDHKGVNLPGVALPVRALTEKDARDLDFGLTLGVDWVALSFVQRPEDVAEVRERIAGRAALMSKIEKPAALERLDEIIALSDGIMVARGDLGVELAPEEVPGVQKRILRAARRAGKPVVIATQMLESMIWAPAPTRAEASDVATAVYDGADALMLSAESASGKHPRGAVEMMNRIIEKVEQDPLYRSLIMAEGQVPEETTADAITLAAKQVAKTIKARAIVSYTTSGSTAVRASRVRPEVPIVVLTPSLATARRLATVWGVHCVHTEDATDFDDMTAKAIATARDLGFAETGESIVTTAGVPFGTPGTTNVLRIAIV
ncbi:MAG: pyruvate kinase [Proteobacteria bacterium]|nr:pyruvate kinase [Pseudomonadota bacterium]